MFARGLSVFALLNLTPNAPLPAQQAARAHLPAADGTAVVFTGAAVPAVGWAQAPRRQPAPVDVVFRLVSSENLTRATSLVSIRNPKTARLIYREKWKGEVIKVRLQPAHVRVELDVSDHRRVAFDVEIRPSTENEPEDRSSFLIAAVPLPGGTAFIDGLG